MRLGLGVRLELGSGLGLGLRLGLGLGLGLGRRTSVLPFSLAMSSAVSPPTFLRFLLAPALSRVTG